MSAGAARLVFQITPHSASSVTPRPAAAIRRCGLQLFINGVPYELIRQIPEERALGAQVWWVQPLFTGRPPHKLTLRHTDRVTLTL